MKRTNERKKESEKDLLLVLLEEAFNSGDVQNLVSLLHRFLKRLKRGTFQPAQTNYLSIIKRVQQKPYPKGHIPFINKEILADIMKD